MNDPTIIAAIITGVATIFGAIIAVLIQKDLIIITNWTRWRRSLKDGVVILINGGSGVGKTSVAWALSRKFNIPSVIGTDLLRETARYYEEQMGTSKENPIFYSSFGNNTESSEVISNFISQTKELTPPIIKIINRIRRKRDPVIIEGVNIVASEMFSQLPTDEMNRIVLINLHLVNEEIHLARLRRRGEKSNEPPDNTDRYIRHIKQIREIDNFLYEDCRNHNDRKSPLIILENSSSISVAVDSIEDKIKDYFKKIST